MQVRTRNKPGQKRLAPFLILIFFCFLPLRSSEGFLFHPLEEELERGNLAAMEKKAESEVDRLLKSLVLMFKGRYGEALERLESSAGTTDVMENLGRGRLLPYLNGMAEIEKGFEPEVSSANVRFRSARRDFVLEEGARKALGACRQKVNAWLEIESQEPILAEIYRSKKNFAFASTLGDEILKKSGVIGIAKFHRIMMLTPEALAFGYSWQDTICHEYVHQALKIKSGLDFPLWFQEGVARFYETLWRDDGEDETDSKNVSAPQARPSRTLAQAVQQAVPSAEGAKCGFELALGDREELLLAAKEGRLVEFNRMEPSLVYLKDEGEISLAFTQVALAVEQLNPKLPKLIQAVSRGKAFREAFKDVYDETLDQFEKRLHEAWLKEAQDKQISKRSGALRTVLLDSGSDTEKLFLGPNLQSLISLGDRLRRKGSIGAALNLYSQAKDIEPNNPYVLSRLARAKAALGKRREALNIGLELVSANPHWPPGYELLGELYEGQGLFRDAIESYAKYFDFNPYHKELVKKTAFLNIDLGEKDAALAFLEKAAILDPKDTEVKEAVEALKPKIRR
ncbi:MAG: hypothetical protein HY747_09405 [Elusimicrobia bacterium]|nr:hypothetical protein [Elusimicrobiota bacterium]